MNKGIPILLSAALLTGCAVGPDYKRPAVTVPMAIRGSPATDWPVGRLATF